mgnify:CR=1 FL=1
MSSNKKSVYLITGGTGSFGTSMLNHLIREKKYSEIRILSRDEKKQEDLRLKINNPKVKFFIGDVRDHKSIEHAFDSVDYVFHAAALKQVPSCEFHPLEAVKTNIHGTENVIDCSIENNIKTMVLLSTDKAVYPINTMGLTKAIAEKIIISKSKFKNSKTTLCATRYGNVMGSRGSVIPLLIDQIKKNKELTVTDPKMTRFLMSLDDSVNLVREAFLNGKNGDIYIQKAPASNILNIAKCLLKIFNKKNKITIIGPRHGEKIHESLCSSEEMSKAINLKKYFRIPTDLRNINYDTHNKKNIITKYKESYNSKNTQMLNEKQLINLLQKQKEIIKE